VIVILREAGRAPGRGRVVFPILTVPYKGTALDLMICRFDEGCKLATRDRRDAGREGVPDRDLVLRTLGSSPWP
jgi:hypothetical protein